MALPVGLAAVFLRSITLASAVCADPLAFFRAVWLGSRKALPSELVRLTVPRNRSPRTDCCSPSVPKEIMPYLCTSLEISPQLFSTGVYPRPVFSCGRAYTPAALLLCQLGLWLRLSGHDDRVLRCRFLTARAGVSVGLQSFLLVFGKQVSPFFLFLECSEGEGEWFGGNRRSLD